MDAISPRKHTGGFSLLQLTLTLVILSISLSIAIPSWSSFSQRQAVIATRANFIATLNLARNTAVNQKRTITLCPSLDASYCSNDHTSWQQGYILFVDEDANSIRDDDEQLLRAHTAFHNSIKIHSSSGRKAIRYRMDGSAWGSNVTLRFCSLQNSANNLAIILHGTGRIRLSKKLSSGGMVTCI